MNKITRLTQGKTYSELNIHQKINFKANLVAYSIAFYDVPEAKPIIKCDAIVFDHLISYGKYSEQRQYKG